MIRTKAQSIKYLIGFLLIVVLALFLGGCSSQNNDFSVSTQGSVSLPLQGHDQVKGTVTAIAGDEVLLRAKEGGTSILQGPVRVGIDAIDTQTLAKLKVGDTIIVYYMGIVGMSSPPFVPATEIEIV